MSLLPESCSKSVTFSNGIKSTEHNAILKLVSLFWTISRASSSATKEISVKTVLGNYVFSLKKKTKKALTVSFKLVWLFSYPYTQQTQARIVSRNYILWVSPLKYVNLYNLQMSIYKMQAGEAFSPIHLPNCELYLENRSGPQRLTPNSLYSCLESIFPRPTSHSQHEILDFLSPDTHRLLPFE